MGRRSNIERLPTPIKQQILDLYQQGVTYKEITNHLKTLGHGVSKSGLNRFVLKEGELAHRMRMASEVADRVIASVNQGDSDNKVLKAATAAIASMVFEVSGQLQIGDQDPSEKTLMNLAKTVKDLSLSLKLDQSREIELRRQILAEQDKKLVKLGKQAGLSQESIDRLRQGLQ